ncbi:MAG TPA: Fe-Mn family superoxide dismutase [Spongiibacteraceae bacterium]
MAIELPSLPYEKDALAPHMSAETLEFHYGKHHKTYVDKLNELIIDTEMENESLLTIVRNSSGPIFNNAAQTWNHTFFWQSLSPSGGGKPEGAIATAIDKAFGSFDKFKETFAKSAAENFGSGWTWLVKNSDGGVAILNTGNADTPIKDSKRGAPMITLDVWEHAYYIDYRNARPKYIDAFWQLANWKFAAANFAA